MGKKSIHIMKECVPHWEESLQESLFVAYRLLHIQTKHKRKESPTDNMFRKVSIYKLACAQK